MTEIFDLQGLNELIDELIEQLKGYVVFPEDYDADIVTKLVL